MNESIFFANELKMDEHTSFMDYEDWIEIVGNFKDLPSKPKYEVTDSDELPF